MSSSVDSLQEQIRRWVLLIGVAQILFGCLVGFIPPTAVGWFRGIVMAHIEFTANGVLMIVVGLLAREMRLGAMALKIWFATLVVGTWTNGLAGLFGAFAGQSSPLMPTLNEKFPRPAGWTIRSSQAFWSSAASRSWRRWYSHLQAWPWDRARRQAPRAKWLCNRTC